MLLGNVKVYYKGKILSKYIQIEEERITGLLNSTQRNEKVIDGNGLLVLPGLIDPHVHLREPGATHKEDFYTGTRAAVAGGFTTVLDMPNNPQPTVTLERLKEKIELAKEKAICDVGFHFGATNENFSEIKKAKPNSLKLILGQTTGSLLVREDSVILKHFENFPKEKPIVIHAEDQEYIEKTGDDGPKAAWRAVEKVIGFAKRTNRRIHIAHTSTKKEIEIAKKWNLATVETAPHYLFLSQKDYGTLGDRKLVKPPLRVEQFRRELWEALEKIDCIGSDHAPHTLEEKENGAFGFPGLETSLALFLDAYSRGLLTIEWIVNRMAERPAEIFGIKGKGRIEKNYFADLTFVDLKKEWIVKGEELETKCKWSPFEGKKLRGKVVKVIFRGKETYSEGEFSIFRTN